MPRSAKEQVDITALLQGILNGYPGNTAIFREYLQNSDDARATKQIFTLDEQQHPIESLCDPSLRHSQGPAILAYNDGVLSERDWEALRKIHSSSKKTDETQTGKNGLGFRASYHLTENPHVLSGETLMILDPHHHFDEHPGGMTIDVVNEGANYRDQLKPFRDFMGDEFSPVSGTVFRLPLRTEKQAKASKIKDTPTSVEQIRTLLYEFCSAELEQVVLFLKHITHIEICHVDAGGHRRVVGGVSIEDIVPSPSSCREVKFRKITLQGEDGSTTASRSWCYRNIVIDKDEADKVVSERLGYDVGDSLIADKLFPSIELATPLNGGVIIGSLFTLLPLPIKTSFPVHLNAVFALTPDRQGLKNIEEVGTIESRERRLVEWNKVIFEVWAPCAWADLLEELSSLNAPWSLWPAAEKNAYWKNLTLNLMKEVLRRNSPVFPVASDVASFLSLDDSSVLISPPSFPLNLIHLLANLGVKIVQPPAHIFAILESDDISIAARVLSPETLHVVLEAGYRHNQWHPHDPNTVGEIIEYLVVFILSPSLGNLIGLPWFVQPDGSPLTFQRPGVGPTCFIPSSEEETQLFGSHLQMLEWPRSSFSDKLLSVLHHPGSSSILNVTLLQPSHVIDVLSRRFTQDDIVNGDPDSPDLAWILAFWTWLEGWRSGNQVVGRTIFKAKVWKNRLPSLYLLPTTSGHLRRLSERVIHISETDSSGASAWEKLGVPLLHCGVSSRAISMLSKEGFIETPEKSGFIPFLLDNSDPLLQNTLLPDDFEAIRRSLYSAAIRQRSLFVPVCSINSAQKKVLEQLSIFYVRNAGGGRPALKSVGATRFHVTVLDDFPLPFQHSPVVYVDLGDPDTKTLIQMLGPMQATDILDLLCIAVDHWDLQPSELQDRIIDLIFDNWRRLSPLTRKKLDDLPFVTVNGTLSRVAPKNLIHPNAPITSLFEDEVGRIPIGRFAVDPMVTTMHSLGFLPTSLDHNIVQERLHYLCQNLSQDQKLFDKAKIFVRLLDQHWDDRFGNPIRSHRDLPWIPQATPYTLCSPNESRDHYRDSTHSDPNFYDLVLTVLPKNCVRISNRDFRSALGWSDRVSTDILVHQLSRTVLLPESEDRYKRLSKLITYMSRLHNNGELSSEDISAIRSELTNCSWIPTSTSTVETVKTEYALLSGEYLKPPFRQINPVGSQSFFMAMGCTERPTLEVLILELQKYNPGPVPTLDIPSVIALLQEIATNHPGFDRSDVSVPDQSRCSRPVENTYYPDTDCLLPSALQDKFPSHGRVSRALSDQLGIQPLSSLVLDLGEDPLDDDDEQMGEDLIDRIRGFLREYDISYALNEFLANADDAHAHKFSILLDRWRPSQAMVHGLISPAFREVQRQDSIILFNDGIFSYEDFKGLRRVGRGGKEGQSDTHGRHGLGALSFYYFTDVVTVISGAYLMILDPSGRYLPPLSRGRKRTSLFRKISDLVGQYPGQLRQYESLFNFSMDTTFYQGTLFCLPLHNGLSQKRCDTEMANKLLKTSYRELAQNAFFFTRLEEITARVRADKDEGQPIWSFLCYRQDSYVLSGGLSYRLLEITSGRKRLQETWMISSSEGTPIPEIHKATALGLKLTDANLIVQLGIRLKPDLNELPKSWLFSNLRLPRTTSLPFHLSTRFAISSNRQSIVFDSPDSRKARDPKSDFNAWILAKVVPPLYLASLTYIINHQAPNCVLPDKRWWLQTHTDDISKHVAEAFHTLLAESDNKLFKTTSGALLSFSDSVFARLTGQYDPVIRTLHALNALRLVTDYVSSGLTKLDTATTVNEAYVRSVLAKTSLESIRILYAGGTISLDDLLALLRYIRKETDLAGLPLLVLSTNIPVLIPDTSSQKIYLSYIAEHAELFESARFLHDKYSTDRNLDEIWSSQLINVARLSKIETQKLICDELDQLSEAGQDKWLKKFWKSYDNLPEPPSLDCLEMANVKLVRGSSRHHSLKECWPAQVIFEHSELKEELLLPLQHLGIDVIKATGSAELNRYLLNRFPRAGVNLNVFKCLAAKNITQFDSLPQEEANILRRWLAASIESSVPSWRQNDAGINRAHLSRLEIWTTQTSEGEAFRCASDLAMLPPGFAMEALSPYLRPGCAVMPHSNRFATVLRFYKGLNSKKKSSMLVTMSPDQILNSMTIPALIGDDAQMDRFANFLRNLFSYYTSPLASISSTLRIFDVDGRARPVHALYDHTVPLFWASLDHTSFVHPRLRHVSMGTLRILGLKYEISVGTFRTCVEAVQAAHRSHIQDGIPTRDELFEMAHLAFDSYKNTLPREIMRNLSHWSTLDSIEFVRPKDIRRQGASYPAKEYCDNELPLLLPPSRFVLPHLEPIAWTQRALFFDEPTEDVTAVNKKLGIPEVNEVVAHLKILTTKIAVNHPGNSTLLSDIKATYKWLNDHAEDARVYMLLLGNEKLFLNVDDPSEEWWPGQWVTAEELVMNIHCDYGDMKHVKKFLLDYANLLRVSGCSTMSRFSRQPTAVATQARYLTKPGLMKTLDEMRKSGKATDMVLVPTADVPEELLDVETELVGQDGSAQTSDVLGSSPELLETEEVATDNDGITAGASSEIPDDVFTDLLELRAHSVILAALIPHVGNWADWKHETSHGKDLLDFDGTYFGAKAVLDFTYTGDFNYTVPQMDDIGGLKNLLYELLALLRIADSWDMPELKAKVELEIHKHDLVQRLLPLYQIMLQVAERYNADDLKDALNQMANENGDLLRRFSLS